MSKTGGFVLVLAWIAAAPVVASNQWHPLDCADWVFLQPGLSCANPVAFPCPVENGNWPACVVSHDTRAIDNAGALLQVRRVERVGETCQGGPLFRTELRRFQDGVPTVLGYVDDRCNDEQGSDTAHPHWTSTSEPLDDDQTGLINFDRVSGSALLTLWHECRGGGCTYSDQPWVIRIDGLGGLFDVFQSYTPLAGSFGFTVPALVEGLAGVDWFDTYYGPIDNPIDFTQATPLQCGFPASSPGVGDFIEIPAGSPTPGPGEGLYFVTAVTYQGQTRYGRQRIGGVLSGRDPALLPECSLR